MASSTPSPARTRFVAEAGRLFAANGYRATTVAHIQVACGLTPGSGALYKHFPSKYELLRAVVGEHERARARANLSGVTLAAPTPEGDELPEEPGDALAELAARIHDRLHGEREMLRLLLRDVDEAPDLLEPIWQDRATGVVTVLQAWLSRMHEHGAVRCPDPASTAAVLGAALLHAAVLDALITREGDADPTAGLRAAWVAHASAALGLEPVVQSIDGTVEAAQLSLPF